LAAFPRSGRGVEEENYEGGYEEGWSTPVSERTLKNEDFPTLGTPAMAFSAHRDYPPINCNAPTIPILRLFPGRPRRAFFSWTTFLGGILFFAWRYEEEEKGRGLGRGGDTLSRRNR
jgi:hypothetical protein